MQNNIKIIKMQNEHIDEIVNIEKDTFGETAWTRSSFERELNENNLAIYYVAVIDDEIVGYGGMWHVVTEGHICNIAVKKEFRNQGIGSKLIETLIDVAKEKEMMGMTLEVRVSNDIAIKAYEKYGFVSEGVRKNYYENNEDANIMWLYL